jgi:hypothetical protein
MNLLFALLKPCGIAGRFEYNKPQFEDIFVLVSIHTNPPFKHLRFFKISNSLLPAHLSRGEYFTILRATRLVPVS